MSKQQEAIGDLYSWSLNFGSGQNPFCLFLDLIGFSEDHYGCPLFTGNASMILGYKEQDMLADALSANAEDPSSCESMIQHLLDAEMGEG